MFTRRTLVVLLVMGALLLLAVVGCGPKPPCPVPPSDVKMAQDKTNGVETSLSEAVAEREGLETELSQTEAKLAEYKDKPEMLRKKLEALKKGSGR